MVIVGGTFEVDPGQRHEFLVSRHDMMRASRAEPGCLEYIYGADPIDPGRVLLYERWESQEALDSHLEALRAGPQLETAPKPRTTSIVIYDVARERTLGG